MKQSQFTEEQIIGILKEHETGVSVADLCRKHGVSDATVYKWKARFGDMEVSEGRQCCAVAIVSRTNGATMATPSDNGGAAEGAGGLRRIRKRSGGPFSRRMERQVEAASGGHDAGQCRAERPARKKVVTPAAEREAVAHFMADHGMSEVGA